MKKHYQCRMRRGNTETIRWIEARAAKVGAQVEVLPSREMWDVVEVYRLGLPEDILKKQQQLSRNSLPSVEGIR